VAETASGEEGLEVGGRGRFQCPTSATTRPASWSSPPRLANKHQMMGCGAWKMACSLQDVPVTSLKLEKYLSFLPAPGSDTCRDELSLRHYSPAETSILALRMKKFDPRTNNLLPKTGPACISPNNAADGPWHAGACRKSLRIQATTTSRCTVRGAESMNNRVSMVGRSNGIVQPSRQSRDRSQFLK
jgi:hypothetical protein